LSKVFKSEQCIQANPCQLEVIEVPLPVVAPVSREAWEDSLDTLEQVEHPVEEVSPEELLAAAKEQAEKILDQARVEKESILAAAVAEAEQIKAQSEQIGFEAGRAAGEAAVRKELAGHLENALALLNEAEMLRADRIVGSEQELLRLAVAIAEKIVGKELRTDSQAIQAMIRTALQKVAGAGRIKVRLHPDDLERLTAEDGLDFDEIFNEPKPIIFEADSAIKGGGCFVETEIGNVDARVKVQCERIVTELLKIGRLS